MNCTEFSHRLANAIETRDAAGIARLEAHAAACGTRECQALWAEHQLLRRGVAAWRPTQPMLSSRLVPRVLGELTGSAAPRTVIAQAVRQRSGRLPGWSVVGLAAALLTAVGVALRSPSPSGSMARRSPAARSVPTVVISSGHDDAAVPGGESYVGLAQEATYFVTDLAMLVVPIDVDSGDDAPAAWFNRLGERIEPVKSGVEGKLGEWFGAPAT